MDALMELQYYTCGFRLLDLIHYHSWSLAIESIMHGMKENFNLIYIQYTHFMIFTKAGLKPWVIRIFCEFLKKLEHANELFNVNGKLMHWNILRIS